MSVQSILRFITICFLTFGFAYRNGNRHIPSSLSSSPSSSSSSQLSSIGGLHSDIEQCLSINPTGVRLFNPVFPNKLIVSLSHDDISDVIRLNKLLDPTPIPKTNLPWKPLPSTKLAENEKSMSSSEIEDLYSKYRHTGHIVWAYTIPYPMKGCMLVNHYQQKVIYLSDYTCESGGKGYEITGDVAKTIIWPPLSLEIELMNKQWEMVAVSENIANGLIFTYLPPEMRKSAWELIFLLLVSPSRKDTAMQAMFDTGLSPKQGLIAYLRLLEQVQARTGEFEEVPLYRQIYEKELKL